MTKVQTGDAEEEDATNAALGLMDDPIELAESAGVDVIWNEIEIIIHAPQVAHAFSSSSIASATSYERPIAGRSSHDLPSRLFWLTLQRGEESLTLYVEPRTVALKSMVVRRPGVSTLLLPPEISAETESEVALGVLSWGANELEIELHTTGACEVLLLSIKVEPPTRE